MLVYVVISFIFIFRFDSSASGFFSTAIRSRIVKFILDRKCYGNEHEFGIDRLISGAVYIAAYPLHDVSKIY